MAKRNGNGNGADDALAEAAARIPVAKVKVPTPPPAPPEDEPDTMLLYYFVSGGKVFAALHDHKPHHREKLADVEAQFTREGRNWKKIRARTLDLPRHGQGGHDVDVCFVLSDGTLEVRSR